MDIEAARNFIIGELITGLPGFRTYHSLEHTLDVHASAVRIAKAEGVDGEGLQLLETAALFHDSGFMVRPSHHEAGSCLLAREHLPRFRYGQEQVAHICALIMATIVPQAPADELGRILCDADLDYLGRDDFFIIGERLFHELRMQGDIADRLQWNRLQENFISRHLYYTDTCRRLREPRKQQHLAEIRAWLAGHA